MIGSLDVVGITSLFGTLFAIACGVGILGSLLWLWRTRDRRREAELGPVVFSDDVVVKFRRRPDDLPSPVAWPWGVRLLVYEDSIALRSRSIPRWLGSLMMMNYTFDAAACRMYVARISRRTWLPGPRDESVVLWTTDKRGWLEIALKPTTATLDDLQRELIRAGVRPADEPAPVEQSG
jgi:hypothetical protein